MNLRKWGIVVGGAAGDGGGCSFLFQVFLRIYEIQ